LILDVKTDDVNLIDVFNMFFGMSLYVRLHKYFNDSDYWHMTVMPIGISVVFSDGDGIATFWRNQCCCCIRLTYVIKHCDFIRFRGAIVSLISYIIFTYSAHPSKHSHFCVLNILNHTICLVSCYFCSIEFLTSLKSIYYTKHLTVFCNCFYCYISHICNEHDIVMVWL